MSETEQPREGEIIFYTTPEGVTRVEVFFQGETFWLSQKHMADLFDVDVRTISEHLQNIFKSSELNEESVIRKIWTTLINVTGVIDESTASAKHAASI